MQSGKSHGSSPLGNQFISLILSPRICVESYTERPIHTAEETILSYIEDLAPDMPVIIVGTKTDKFLKFENIGDDPKTQQDTLNNQTDSFRRIYEEKVKEVQLKFVFVSQGE